MLDQPFGAADMVGVEMGADDAGDRPAFQGGLEMLAPQFMGNIGLDAGIDQHPAVAVIDQVEIDVVQREGQGKAQPADTGRDFDIGAGRGRLRERIVQLGRRCGVCGHEWTLT